MSNKRMNHVFNEMVVKAGRDIDTAELQFINGGVSATFFCPQQAIHAAHAINNHDRMVEEIAELKGFIKKVSELDIETFRFEIQGGDEDCIEYVCTDIVDEAVDLLDKLNQEGEG